MFCETADILVGYDLQEFWQQMESFAQPLLERPFNARHSSLLMDTGFKNLFHKKAELELICDTGWSAKIMRGTARRVP